MARKKWVPKTDITPNLLKSREKRKWQISFRRYVLERTPCSPYAPFFGLDIKNLRHWIELQFEQNLGWDDFAKKWQFEHVIPVNYFDFTKEEDLKRCWNFINIRVDTFHENREEVKKLDLLTARKYFEALYKESDYQPCILLLEKITEIEDATSPSTQKQSHFLRERKPFLDILQQYSSFEFELLNSGRTPTEIAKEVNFLKKF
ncbi:MAG: hypothetical protein ABI813_15635 [Bacteroidota bacterium]